MLTFQPKVMRSAYVFTEISENGSCPQGWLEYGNNCYSIEDHKERWLSAHEYCRYLGSNLVSFQDNEEADYIAGIYQLVLWNFCCFFWGGGVGGTDTPVLDFW